MYRNVIMLLSGNVIEYLLYCTLILYSHRLEELSNDMHCSVLLIVLSKRVSQTCLWSRCTDLIDFNWFHPMNCGLKMLLCQEVTNDWCTVHCDNSNAQPSGLDRIKPDLRGTFILHFNTLLDSTNQSLNHIFSCEKFQDNFKSKSLLLNNHS